MDTLLPSSHEDPNQPKLLDEPKPVRRISVGAILGIIVFVGVAVAAGFWGPGLFEKFAKRTSAPSGLCVPNPYGSAKYSLMTELPTSTYSYVFKNSEGTVVTGAGHDFSVGPMLIDTDRAFDQMLAFMRENKLYGLSDGFAVYGKKSEQGFGMFIVSNIDPVKPPHDNAANVGLFAVYPGNTASRAENEQFILETLRNSTVGECAVKYDPTTNSDGAAEFQKIKAWIESLPQAARASFTDAEKVSDIEFSDASITTDTYYDYERCIRYLLDQGVAAANRAGKPLASASIKTFGAGYETESLYTNYLVLLRQKNSGSLDGYFPEMLSKNNNGSFSINGSSSKPSRAACSTLQTRASNPIRFDSL